MDDWDDDDWPAWLTVGSAETLQEVERPRFRSVSPAAHRCFQIDRDRAAHQARMQGRAQIGFHRPVR